MQTISNYLDKTEMRYAFNSFTETVFGNKFVEISEPPQQYIPFSITNGTRILANISIGLLELSIYGQAHPACIIQTVGVLPEFRGNGYVRKLFNDVFKFIQDMKGIAFLFAGDTVLNFYQQFGFHNPYIEYDFFSSAPSVKFFRNGTAKITTDNKNCYLSKLREYAHERTPISHILGAKKNSGLLMYLCKNSFPESIYYIEAIDIFVLFSIEQNVLTIYDIVGKNIPFIEELFPCIGNSSIEKIRYMFTPDKLCAEYQSEKKFPRNLFVSKNFPLIEEPFCIPETSRG